MLGTSNSSTSRLGRSSTTEPNAKDLIDFEHEKSNHSASSISHHVRTTSNAAAGLSAITEALNVVESLRLDLEKLQMGVQLLTLSVTKLTDIVTTQPGCCGGIFEMFTGASNSGLQTPSNHYRVNINRNVSGNYTTSTNNILHSAIQRSSSNEGPDTPTHTQTKKAFNFIANTKNRKQGYENIGGKNFTIEGVDDYDD